MFFDLANSALAVLVIGLLISLAFLLPENQGRLEQSASTTLQGLKLVSGLWFLISIGYLLSSLAEIFGSGIGEILKVNILQSFITQITLGKLLAYQVLVALIVFIFSNLIKKNGGALALLIFALSGIVPHSFKVIPALKAATH